MNVNPILTHMATPFIVSLHRFLVDDHPQQHSDVRALAAILGVELEAAPQATVPQATAPQAAAPPPPSQSPTEPAAATSSAEAVERVQLTVSALPSGRPMAPSTAPAARDHEMGIATLAGLQLDDGPTPCTIVEQATDEVEVFNQPAVAYADSRGPAKNENNKRKRASNPALVVHENRDAAVAAAASLVAEDVPSAGTTVLSYAGPTRQHAGAKRVQQAFASGQQGGGTLLIHTQSITDKKTKKQRLDKLELPSGCLLSHVLKMQWTYNGATAIKNYKQVMSRLKNICKHVTGQASCTSLSWLDDEEAVMRFFRDVLPTPASPAGKSNSYDSLGKWADALRRLYVFYHGDFGAKQAQLMRYQGVHDNFCELHEGEKGKATEAEVLNTPSVAQIDQLLEAATGQTRVLLLHAKQFIGRNMNYICQLLQRTTEPDGTTELWRYDEEGLDELTQLDEDLEVHADGYPLESNAIIRTTAADGTHSYEYFQSAYKTSKIFGRKVGACTAELGAAITAMGFEGRQSLFQRANGDPVCDDSHVRELCKSVFTPLGMTDVTPTLLRRAMCNSPKHRAAFSLLIDTAAVMNHSLGMHCGGRYTGKGLAT